MQIDHVVALSNAWQTGAQGWPPEKRLAFANDPLHAVDEHDRFDPALEDAEERAGVPLVHGVLAGDEGDVGRGAAEPLAVAWIERPEQFESRDLFRRHHGGHDAEVAELDEEGCARLVNEVHAEEAGCSGADETNDRYGR